MTSDPNQPGMPQVPPAWQAGAKKPRRGVVLVALGALALLVLLLAAVVVAGSLKTNSGAVATTVTSTRPLTTSTVRLTTTTASPMKAWLADIAPSLDAMGADFKAVSAATDRRSMAEVNGACVAFQGHVADALRLMPSPDKNVNEELAAGLGYYGQAADACISGSAVGDFDLLMQYVTFRSQGVTHVNAAHKLIDALVD